MKLQRKSDNRWNCIGTVIRTFCSLVFLLSSPVGIIKKATAQTEIALVSESEFFADIPSVATVTRLPTPKSETPAAVTIIDKDMIQASGARDLVDLLRLVPGFQVASPRGFRPAATYHGLGDEYSRRMQILIDGRSVYGALFGHVSWSTQGIAIEDIERIEVVRGPNSVSYGANAFLGTINIITSHASQMSGMNTKFTSGNRGVADGLVRFGTSVGSGDLRVSAKVKSDEGLDQLDDDSEIKLLNIRADIPAGDRDLFLIQASLSNAMVEEGEEGDLIFPKVTTNTDAHFEQFRWQRRLANDNELIVQFYHNYRKLDYSYFTEPVNLGPILGSVSLPIDFDAFATRDDLEFQHTLAQWRDWRLVWGAGVRRDKVDSDAFFADTGEAVVQSSRIFGNLEWLASANITVNTGLMWEDSDYTDLDLSPRVAINYKFSSKHTVRAAWSEAIRMPSLFEQLGNYRISFFGFNLDQLYASQNNLNPESMDSFELGYFGQFPDIATTVDIRMYSDKIADFISPVPVDYPDLADNLALGFRNESEIQIDGVDLEIRYRSSRNGSIIFTYAYMDAAAGEVSSNIIVTQRDREASVPKYSGALQARYSFEGGWSGSVSYYRVDQMLWLDSGTPVDGYDRLDLRFARQIHTGGFRGEVAFVIQNLGEDYEEFRSNQLFKQRSFLTVNMSF